MLEEGGEELADGRCVDALKEREEPVEAKEPHHLKPVGRRCAPVVVGCPRIVSLTIKTQSQNIIQLKVTVGWLPPCKMRKSD